MCTAHAQTDIIVRVLLDLEYGQLQVKQELKLLDPSTARSNSKGRSSQ